MCVCLLALPLNHGVLARGRGRSFVLTYGEGWRCVCVSGRKERGCWKRARQHPCLASCRQAVHSAASTKSEHMPHTTICPPPHPSFPSPLVHSPGGVRTSSRWLPPRFPRATSLLPHPQTTPQICSRFLYGLGWGR